LPLDEDERIAIFQKAAALNPCWKCGEIGHVKKGCSSTQQASKPRLTLPPTIDLDVAPVLQNNGISDTVEGIIKGSKGPIESYCDLLSTAVERDNIKVLECGVS